MSFVFFIILNGVLILRPAEMIQAIFGAPIYNVVILICIAATFPQILSRLAPKELADRPLTICMIGLQITVISSLVTSMNLDMLSECVSEFAKLLIYFLLLMAVVTTKERLRGLMFWTTMFLLILTVLTLLTFYGVLDIPALTPMSEGDENRTTGARTIILRLQASGIFNNPNAFARVLTTGMLLAIYWFTDPKMRLYSPLWLGVIGIFGYAQIETKSRGGFLGLVFGLMMLFIAKFGVKRGLPLVLVGAPALVLLVGGRQADMQTDQGTGEHRIQLWRMGFDALVATKFLGVGMNMYHTEAHGYVAHNSFVHSYVELGFIGGTFFFAMFYLILITLWNLRKDEEFVEDPELRRLRPYLLAVIGGETMGLLSISRSYTMSTYLILGMGAVYLQLLRQYPAIKIPRFNSKLAVRLFLVSLAFFILNYAYVRYKTRFE